MRIHGTTAQRPLEILADLEASCLLEVPDPYDVPVFPNEYSERGKGHGSVQLTLIHGGADASATHHHVKDNQ